MSDGGSADCGAVRVMEVVWPSGIALQGEISNQRALRPLTAVRGERHRKKACHEYVRCGPGRWLEISVVDASKRIQSTSKPGSAPYLGISLGVTRLLPRWCPAYRQHEPGQGSRMERVKVSPRN